MSLGQANANQDYDLVQVWYVPNATQANLALVEGQVIVYDTGASAVTSFTDTLSGGQISFGSRKNLVGRRCTDPAAGLVGGFAGIVESSSAGVVVPSTGAFITLIKPRKGDVAQVYTKANCTKNSTVLRLDNAGANIYAIADGTDAVGSATTSTKTFDQVGIALQTLDTSTTAGLTWVRFI